jgi:hypothetical protein
MDGEERKIQAGLTVAEVFSGLGLDIPCFLYFRKNEKRVKTISYVEIDGLATEPSEVVIQENMNIQSFGDKINMEFKAILEALAKGLYRGIICPTEKLEECQKFLKNCGLDSDNFSVSEEDGSAFIFFPGMDISGSPEYSIYDFIYYEIQPEEFFGHRKWKRISDILQNTTIDTYLLIDRKSYDQMAEVLHLPQETLSGSALEKVLKTLGFKGIMNVERGLKIKLMEETEELIRRLSLKVDNQDTTLPLISFSSFGLFRYFQASFENFSKYISSVKSPFDLETMLIKKMYVTKCATVGIYGDLDDGLLMEEEITDTDFVLTVKEFAKYALGQLDIESMLGQSKLHSTESSGESHCPQPYSVLGTFSELMTGQGQDSLTYVRMSENILKTELEIRGHRFSAVIGHGREAFGEIVEILEQNPSSIDLIEISEDLFIQDNPSPSLVKDQEVNDLYKKYLTSPGNSCVRKS